ncbi:MAG: hypothetical protein JRG74_03410 [Deltaproteobacteria bacterium]|nr:hypothetical protein [Deltaproteobacteria bacterium]
MPCKRDRYDIKRIETDANSALLILGVKLTKNINYIKRSAIMSLELEQAIEAAKNNDLQEAILKLCEAIRQIENNISYLQASFPE